MFPFDFLWLFSLFFLLAAAHRRGGWRVGAPRPKREEGELPPEGRPGERPPKGKGWRRSAKPKGRRKPRLKREGEEGANHQQRRSAGKPPPKGEGDRRATPGGRGERTTPMGGKVNTQKGRTSKDF